MHVKTERRCIACRQAKLQAEMLRITRVNGEFMLDTQHKINGRGAYICKDKNCINLAVKKHLLNRAFKTNVGDEIYLKIGEYEQDC